MASIPRTAVSGRSSRSTEESTAKFDAIGVFPLRFEARLQNVF